MKGPGGILLIGVGVFVIALGWTGAYAKVYEVLTGNAPSGDGSGGGGGGIDIGIPDQPKPPATNDKACQSDPHCPVGEKCFGGVCISTEEPGNDNICGSGRELVSISSTGKKRCALNRQKADNAGRVISKSRGLLNRNRRCSVGSVLPELASLCGLLIFQAVICRQYHARYRFEIR